MKKVAKYVAFNGLFAYALYAGVVNGADGWANVVKFFTWLIFIVGMFALADTAKEEFAKKPDPRTVPNWFDYIVDIIIAGVFAFNGWFFYATIYLLGNLWLHGALDEAMKLRAENPKKYEAA